MKHMPQDVITISYHMVCRRMTRDGQGDHSCPAVAGRWSVRCLWGADAAVGASGPNDRSNAIVLRRWAFELCNPPNRRYGRGMQPPAMTVKSRRSKPLSRIGAPVVPAKSAGDGVARDKVKFGDVVVTVQKPGKAEIKQNVDFSSDALARANSKIINAGVRLYPKMDVPLFFADKQTIGVFMRKLNGTVQHGVLEDGQFKVLDDWQLKAIG